MITIQKEKNEIVIKTNLSPYVIIAYTEKIIKLKGWSDTMSNRIRAKIILNALMILEHQTKTFFPCDFEELWTMLEQSIKNN